MNEISTAAKASVPAYLKNAIATAEKDDSLYSGIGGGFPVVSIRGRAWRIVTNGVENVVTIPESDDPAPSIEVVVLKGNRGTSKVFYASAYVEGSDSKPDCFSNNGVAPDPQVEHPQSSRCATCKQNVWGSKITPQGTKTKACSDSRRLAIAPAGDLQNPMLLRVPAASLADLAEYGRGLQRKGVPYHAVITKLGFDQSASYPKITFKPQRFVSEEQFKIINDVRDNSVVDEILGGASGPVVAAEATLAAPAPAPVKPAPAPAPAPKPEPEAEPDMFAEEPAKPAKPTRAAKPKPAPEPTAPEEDEGVDALEKLVKDFDL